jgi:hypothetical protein
MAGSMRLHPRASPTYERVRARYQFNTKLRHTFGWQAWVSPRSVSVPTLGLLNANFRRLSKSGRMRPHCKSPIGCQLAIPDD